MSRIDILIVVGVVALTVPLIFPLITSSRETARRNVCAANLERIGRALHAYHHAWNSLPPLARWATEGLDINQIYDPHDEKVNITSLPLGGTVDLTHENWVILLLPHLGEETLADSFDLSVPISHPQNAQARTTQFPVFTCPADQFNRSDNRYLRKLPGNSQSHYARGDYAINGGTHRDYLAPGTPASPCADGFHYVFDPEAREFQWWGSGVAGINKSIAFDDIARGTSHTVAINEIRAGIHAVDSRGAWALGQIGASATFEHGLYGDAVGPNNPDRNSDDIYGCSDLHDVVSPQVLTRERMGCCAMRELHPDWPEGNLQAGSRSMHQGGVFALMADGATTFLADTMDPGVWHVMHSREIGVSEATDTYPVPSASYSSQKSGVSNSADGDDDRSIRPSTVTNTIGMKLVRLPAGEFIMGLEDILEGKQVASPPDVPPHPVSISKAFYLSAFEVTQKEYQAVMGTNPSSHSTSPDESRSGGGCESFPVERVSWFDAVEFCHRLSGRTEERSAGRTYRLPTEAEWEYVCRAGSTDRFVNTLDRQEGDESGSNAGSIRGGVLPIGPVGSYPPNEFGIYDMRGNVWEWCADWFARDYYLTSPHVDPQGPPNGVLRVVRGGDWTFVGEICDLHFYPTPPTFRNQYIGFRVVCD